MIKNNSGTRFFCFATFAWWIIGFILVFIFSKKELFTFVNAKHTQLGDWIMPYITKMGEELVIIPAALLLLALNSKFRTPRIIIICILSLGMPSVITQILKFTVAAPRPLSLFNNAGWVHIVEGYKNNFHNSWPSGHTTGAFSLFFLLSYLLKRTYQWWAFLFFLLALLVGYSRIYLAQHFFEDVLAGSIIGTVIPYLVIYFVEKVPFKKGPEKDPAEKLHT